MAAPAILIVTEDAARAKALHEALEPHVALTAKNGADARKQLSAQSVAVVLSDLHLKDGSGLALLEHCATTYPGAIRMLMGEHGDLPEVVQARGSGLVRRVISKTARPRRVRKVVADELGIDVEVTATKAAPQRGASQATLELLRWTVERIAHVPGLVIRPLPEDVKSLQFHLVVPTGDRFQKLRRELPLAWSAPLRERGHRPTAEQRNHPVLQHLPRLHGDDEVFALADQGDTFVYLALLPWRKEPRMTVVLGVAAARYEGRHWELLAAAHATALEETEELELPADRERAAAGGPAFEHDWLTTATWPNPGGQPSGLLERITSIFGRGR
jgi:CheY-like chemotaxis protein